MDFLFDPFQEESEASTATRLAETPSTLGERMSGLMYRQPTRTLLDKSEQAAQDPSATGWRSYLAGNVGAYGGTTTADDLLAPPTPMISPEETKKYSPDGTALSDKPIPEGLAQVLGKEKSDQITADSAIKRFQDAHSWPVNLATDIAASFTDPLNIGAALIPGIGEEAVAAKLGLGATFLGRTAARAISGATFGVAAQIPISTMQAAFNPDYGMRDFLYDVAIQAPINAAIAVVGLGTVHEGYRFLTGKPPLNYAAPEARAVLGANPQDSNNAMRGAAGQIVEGKPVDVDGFFYRPPPTDTALGRFLENPNLPGRLPEAGPMLDVDRIARETDPSTFRVYDTLAAQKQDLNDLLDKPGVGTLSDQVKGTREQIATLRERAAKASGRLAGRLGDQIADLERTLEATEGKIEAVDVGAVRSQVQAIDQQMRDLAPAVSAAYDEARTRQAMLGAGLAAEQEIRLQAIRDAFNRPILSEDAKRILGWRPPDVPGLADRARALATQGWAPGIRGDVLEATTKAIYDRPEPVASVKPEPPTKPPAGWVKPAAAPEGEAAAAKPAEAPAGAPAPTAKFTPEAQAAIDKAERDFAALDPGQLLPEERAAIAQADEGVRQADEVEGSFMEAASCLEEAGE